VIFKELQYIPREERTCVLGVILLINRGTPISVFPILYTMGTSQSTGPLVHAIRMPDDGELLKDSMLQDEAVAVSEIGTAAWLLESESGTGRMEGVSIAPGCGQDQSSFRSELTGL
jgi:hypothetical protein